MIDEISQRLLDRTRPMRIHLLGVAGSGMSGLATLLLEMGHRVSGSDRVTSRETERLQLLSLAFSSPHSAEAVSDAEVVVYSSAIKPDNVALVAADREGIPSVRRAECLAAILHTRKGVVVSGTHGKTTSSAMCAHVLKKSGRAISHYVGAEIPVLGANAHWDEESDYLVAEGDESDGTLALYRPSHAIVLNIEAEHLDFYNSLEEIVEVFRTLLEQTSEKIIYCAEDVTARELCSGCEGALSYGWDDADFTASDVTEGRGVISFTVWRRSEKLGRVELGILGRHNVLNALAAIALADDLGVDFSLVARSLASFAGAKRRFESVYLSSRFRIIDDYGHHPTEIEATLQTARSLKPERIVALFQPHRYSRTQCLAEEFGVVLQEADIVFVTDVYPASEAPIEGVSGRTIVEAVERHGNTRCVYHQDLTTAHHVVGNLLQPGDLLITLGAGNVHEAGRKIADDLVLLEALRSEFGEGELEARLYEAMRRHTTMLVGGPAQFWVEPRTFPAFGRAVVFFKERGVPVRVMGRGSNLLVRDGGIRGAVIHPAKGEFGEVTVEAELLTAGAGARLKKVASVAEAAGLGGFAWMEGIPGNVGGGLRMNAGAMGLETFDQVVSVMFLDEDGEIRTRSRAEIEAFYRNVPKLHRNYALQVIFRGTPAGMEEIREEMSESRNHRRSTQPVAASAGCIFKNPDSIGAGQLIDELGLKGKRVGKAEVSAEHGNFIVNRGKAEASDVLRLIDELKAEVKEKRGIDLETEVQILGEDQVSF
ncbi:MAG: UDP-N-acetylmuramate--L-alanine ligase [Roseibacillus sp.]